MYENFCVKNCRIFCQIKSGSLFILCNAAEADKISGRGSVLLCTGSGFDSSLENTDPDPT